MHKEFPIEFLLVAENKKLFCDYCRTEIASKKSSVQDHLNSASHKLRKSRIAVTSEESKSVIGFMKAAIQTEMLVMALHYQRDLKLQLHLLLVGLNFLKLMMTFLD